MIELSKDKKELKICIPIPNLNAITKYHQSIIHILDRIEIDDCNPDLRDNLTIIYELLSHLNVEADFFAHHQELLKAGLNEKNTVHK